MALVHRLEIVLRGIASREQVEALVKNGFDRPHKIIKAKQKDLEAVPGIGKSTAAKLKARHTGRR